MPRTTFPSSGVRAAARIALTSWVVEELLSTYPLHPKPQVIPHHGRVVEHGHDDDLRPRLDPAHLVEEPRGHLERHPRLHDDHVRLRLAARATAPSSLAVSPTTSSPP
jgi:hypothetical protein